MSIKKNLAVNYLGQIYVGLISIALIPVYIQLLGAEAYGLVGFYISLQAVFQLLDMGLSSTVVKVVSGYRGGETDSIKYRFVLRGMEMAFGLVSLVITLVLFVQADWITYHWLSYEQLKPTVVQQTLLVIALVSGLRWLSSFYKGILIGYEKLVLLNVLNCAFATFRFVLVIPILYFYDSSPLVFFYTQGVVVVVELCFWVSRSYRLLPSSRSLDWSFSNLRHLKAVYAFGVSASIISLLWVFLREYDKVLLSKWLPLSEYAYYMAAVLAASCITYFNSGVYNVFLPRFSVLRAEGRLDELKRLYSKTTQLVMVALTSVALVLFGFSDAVLFVWTGEAYPAEISRVLSLFALGNLFVPLLAFPYMIQYAYGNLNISICAYIVAAIVMPVIFYLMFTLYGVTGAAISWLVVVFSLFFFTSWFVHEAYFEGFHWGWLFKNVVSVISGPMLVVFALQQIELPLDDRIVVFFSLVAVFLGIFLAAALSSSLVREYLRVKADSVSGILTSK